MWISPKTLRLPDLASFADSKLLDLSRASNSISSRINRTLCVTCYIRYVRISACTVGTVAIIRSSSLAGELLLLRRGFYTIVLHYNNCLVGFPSCINNLLSGIIPIVLVDP